MHTCLDCKNTREKPLEPRLPRGWKRRDEGSYCDNCWGKRYILRAVVVPIAAPIESTWEELRAALREMWIATTHASNWIVTELYARDVRPLKGDEKIPVMVRQYLYPEIRPLFPTLPSQTVAALE